MENRIRDLIRIRYIYASRLLLINIGFSEFNVLINPDMFR